MASEIKGFYDGSGDRNTHFLTLAGFAGTPAAWNQFGRLWKRFACYWGYPRPNDSATFSCLHMSDAFTLNGEFSKERGWTEAKVRKVIQDLLNWCIAPISFSCGTEFRGASATVDLRDYKRAAAEFSALHKVKSAEALCVDYVTTVALGLLPDNSHGVAGKSGTIELIFDRNERFQRTIRSVWEANRGYGKLLGQPGFADAKTEPALQAADFLAWSANRAYTREDTFLFLAPMATGVVRKLFLYDDIVAAYARAYELLGRARA